MAGVRAERDEDMKYLMLGEEGYLDRPSGVPWYEASEVMDIDGLKYIEEDMRKTRKLLRYICNPATDRSRRLARLMSCDHTHAFSDSGIPEDVLLGIWESDKVSRYWKGQTLSAISKNQFYGVNVVPLEYQWSVASALAKGDYDRGPYGVLTRGMILQALYQGDFDWLDAVVWKVKKTKLGIYDYRTDPGGKMIADVLAPDLADKEATVFWGQMLFHVLMLAEYDIEYCGCRGNTYLRPAVEWIEKLVPGTVAKAVDRLGNNALMYLYATMTVSNPSYAFRTAAGIELAEDDAQFLKGLGCDASRKNVFGVSYEMFVECLSL